MSLHRWLVTLALIWLPLGSGRAAYGQDEPPLPPPPVAETKEPRFRDFTFLANTAARRTPIVNAVERVKSAVVNIHSERLVNKAGTGDPYAVPTAQNRINGMGTGIIIDPRGYIITNHHVVEDVNLIRVRLSDGSQQNATVLARSPEQDLALLKIDVNRPLPTIPIGTASDLMIGETVIAIGNAFGYEDTVSVGIVSALKRDVTLNKDMAYKSLIQTNATINPGNSGGPLLNIDGDLVGVNVAIRAGAQGIAFAIPADTMVRTAADMLRSRRRNQGSEGFTARDRYERTGQGLVRTVVVERADMDGAAGQAGLRRGDVLMQVGDVRVGCSLDVERALLEKRNGETVAMVVRRQGKDEKLSVVLQSGDGPSRTNLADVVWTKLGVRLAGVESERVVRVNRQLHGGLEVMAVHPDSPAARAGLQRGDILVGLHQWETLTVDNVAYVLTHPELATFSPISFYILREGQVRRGWIPMNETK